MIYAVDQGDYRGAEEIQELWLREAETRCRQIDAGTVELIPGEEVLARLKAKIVPENGC